MKITFAQGDITAALRAHIASQGISLEGKAVDIKFTMKKGNAGVAADVSIENSPALPDLSEPVKPVLTVVASTPASSVVGAVAGTAADEPKVIEAVAQATGTSDAAAEATTAAGTKPVSLFN